MKDPEFENLKSNCKLSIYKHLSKNQDNQQKRLKAFACVKDKIGARSRGVLFI